MSDDDSGYGSFDELMRAIAREVSKTMQERADQLDLDGVAETFGVDPNVARQWLDGASQWFRSQVDQTAGEPRFESSTPPHRHVSSDPLTSAGPHPLDLPTNEQGVALAALGSDRWTVEPGTEALAASGPGPGPSDALGLVRELRARDWIDADGEITLVGRHALGRWLQAADPR